MEELIIGSHVSFNKSDQLLGSVKEALSYGANTFMFYTGAPQNTARSEIDMSLAEKAFDMMKENNIDINNVIVHAPYIINLANRGGNWDFAIEFFKEEIKRAAKLGIKWIVFHPGSHVSYTREEGLRNIIDALNKIIDENTPVTLCLETMAGKGSELGMTFEELKTIIDGVTHNEKLAVCLDTCHVNDAGYDLSDFDKVLDEFDRVIGLERLVYLHINDSKNEMGSRKDRHENFGFGKIGFDNLIKILYHPKLKGIPKVLESPYVTKDDESKERLYPPYKFEIDMIRKKEFNANLISDIRKYYDK